MIFKKKRISILVSALAFLALTFSLVGYNMISASSEGQWSAIEIQETYSVGDTIIAPNAKIEANGQSYDATCTIIFPNGAAQKSNSFIAKESGEYQLIYKAVVNGRAVEKTVKFLVNNTLYSVGNELSSASYGTNSYLPGDVNGINLSLAPNDTFKFNRIIDLSEATRNDKIIKFYLTPKAVGEPDAAQIKIRLTDIYNPDNYVTMTYKTKILSEVNYGTIYRSVGASNQPQAALAWSRQGAGDNTADVTYIQYGAQWFTATRNPIYGAGVNISSDGNPRNLEFIDNYEYFAMDYESRQVFAHPHWFTFEPYNLIADLDDYRIMGDSLWNGFTTGECLLSIEGENYITSSLNMFITEVAGHDLTDFNFKDDRAPVLTVDYGDYKEDSLPFAVVNKPYTIYDAVAYDNLDGEVEPTITVYYNYYSDMRTLVNVQNGAFTPKRAGVYTVIYTAKDSVGNVSTASYDITACVPENPLSINSSIVNNATAAATVKLAKYEVANSNGNNEVKITATLKSNPEIVYEVDKEDLSFMPLYAGTYTVKYVVKDYVSTAEYGYDLTVAAPSAPQIVYDPVLPKYLIKGASYVFDSVNAYSYAGAERTEVPTRIYVSEDGATELTAIETSYTVSANSSVTLVYKAVENGQTSEKHYTIPVVDVNYGNEITYMSKYFQGVSFVSKDGEKGIVYTNENAKGDVKLAYIRDAFLYGFKFDFDFVTGYENFEKLAFTLTEVGNTNNVLKITVQKTPTAYICALQDGREYEIAYSSNLTTLTISYSPATNAVTFNGAIVISASDFGFKGFNGNYVTFETTFVKANGKAGIEFSRLYMQPLMSTSADNIAPQFYEMKKDSTRCSLNTVFTIYAPIVFDVIDPNVKMMLTVLDPEGGHVTAKDGTLLSSVDASKDYQIDLNEYGAWSVVYLIVDHRGNNVEPSYVIHVEDYIAPTVEIGKAKTSYRVGETLKLASVVLSDNYSKSEKISKSVLILSPDSVMELYDEKGEYRLEKEGEYTIYFYVTDEADNLTIASYKIKVGG